MKTHPSASWPETAWAAVLLAIGSVTLGTAWDGWAATAVIVAAAVLPAVIVRALTRRTSSWFAALFVLIVVVGVVVLLGRDARADGRSAVSALLDAVPTLLTGPLPAPARPELLAPGVLLAGVVGAFVGVRLSRPRRHRLTPVVGATLLYAAGLALTAAVTDAFGGLAAGLVVVAVLGWVLLGHGGPTRLTVTDPSRASEAPRGAVAGTSPARGIARGGRRAGAALALALVTVPLVVAAALPPRDDALDLRDHVDPPVTFVTVTNPLPQLAAWARDPEGELFAVSGDAYPLHLAVLSDYDGASWSAPSAFRPLDVTAPRLLAPGERQAVVRARVRLVDVPTPWLPAPGEPESVDLGGALVDPDSGSAIAPGSRAGTAYEVVGRIDAPTAQSLEAASLPDSRLALPYLEVPRLPQVLRAYAESAVRTASTPLQRALAVEAAVRGSRTTSPTAPAGSSYRRIEQFLFGEEGTAGAQTGTSEQFATSFAVLARAVGLPSRVVVGFEPGEPAPGSTSGERIVRGKHATAWPEVYFAGQGWVPFSPTPDGADLGPDLDDDTPITPPEPTQVPPPASTTTPQTTPGEVAPVATQVSPWVWAGTAAAVVVLGPVVALAVARAARRRRQRALGAPGTWAAALDAARLSGERAPHRDEPRAVAARLDTLAGSAPGSPSARQIVEAAEAGAFGPPRAEGASGTQAGPAAYLDAGEVWGHLRSLERGLRKHSPLGRRLLWHVHPAPLRRRPGTERNIPANAGWTGTTGVPDDGDRSWAPDHTDALTSGAVGGRTK